MEDKTYNSISTNNISTAILTASTIYARTSVSTVNVYADYLRGDGSGLRNLTYNNFTADYQRNTYGAYTIPWNAMESQGSLTLLDANWDITGKITVTNMSVSQVLHASTVSSHSLVTVNGRIGNLECPVINNFLTKTDTVKASTIDFFKLAGSVIFVDSTITKNISTDTLTTNILDITRFTALYGAFSTVSTGTWEIDIIQLNRLQLYDYSSLTHSYITLSANKLYLNNSSILSNVPSVDELVNTTGEIIYQLYVASNSLYPHLALSSLSAITTSQWSISQVAFSTLSTGIGGLSLDTKIAASNLSVAVDNRITNLSTYTNITTSNISTNISDRLTNYQLQVAGQFVTLNNYIDREDNLLKIGLSSTAYHISLNTSTQISNTSTFIGEDIKNIKVGISSVALLTTRSISTIFSTLSTQISWNFSTTAGNLSTSISNLSTNYQPTFLQVKNGISTNASNISVMWGSVFSSLSTSGIYQAVSSFSTVIGNHLILMSNNLDAGNNGTIPYINNTRDTLSTVTGSNLSIMKFSISTLSTTVGSNTSSVRQSLVSTISTFSTSIGINFTILSSIISSNTSTLTQTQLSTLSTVSFLQISVSSLSTVINSNFSTISANIYTFSNISLSAFSSLSTSIGKTSNSLSTNIGQTSNYLSYFSTISTSIGSTNSTLYSILALGISSVSTSMGNVNFYIGQSFSTKSIFASSISVGTLLTSIVFTSSFITSSISTSSGFFNRFQGSTMSSLTQQVGQLITTQMIASSFSGNLNDATTVIIQTI